MKSSENTSVSSSSSSLSNQRKSKPSEPKLSQTKPVFKLEQEPYAKFSVIKFTPVLNNNNNNRNSRNVNNEQDGINGVVNGIKKPKIRGRPKVKKLEVGSIEMMIDSTESIDFSSFSKINDDYIRVKRPSEHKGTCTSQDNIIESTPSILPNTITTTNNNSTTIHNTCTNIPTTIDIINYFPKDNNNTGINISPPPPTTTSTTDKRKQRTSIALHELFN